MTSSRLPENSFLLESFMRLILLHEGKWNFLEFVFRIKVELELVGEDVSC